MQHTKLKLFLFALLALHSLVRTFYVRDLHSLDTYIILFIIAVFWVLIVNKLAIIVTIIVYLALNLTLSPDTFFSTASWNYLNLGNSIRLELPTINFYGDDLNNQNYTNISELAVGIVSKILFHSESSQFFFYFYRLLNVVVIFGVLLLMYGIMKSRNFTQNSNQSVGICALLTAIALYLEGASGHYIKHSLGFALALVAVYRLEDLRQVTTLHNWLKFLLIFLALCLTVETYPLLVLALLGTVTLFSGFKPSFVFGGFISCLIFMIVLYFIFGFGRAASFSASPQVNYSYIIDVVYGHPVKFLVGLVFYVGLVINSLSNVTYNIRKSNIYDLGIISTVIILLVALVDVRLSPVLVVFHRFLYFLVIYGIITGAVFQNVLQIRNLVSVVLVTLALNKIHHMYIFKIQNPNFKYDSILPITGNGSLPFSVLDHFSKTIPSGSLVYLDERFSGHSIINFWFQSRPFFIAPGLISSISTEDDVNAQNNLKKLQLGHLSSLRRFPDFIVTMSPNICKVNKFYVISEQSEWLLCKANLNIF